MNFRKTLLACCVAIGSIATMGATPALADIYVRVGPPAPRYEPVPVVAPGYVWVPGYWSWNGHHYVWYKGHRVRGRHGEHWVPNHWVEDRGRWHREGGHWDRD